MDNEYKISLGVDVDVSDIQSQINKADIKPIPIKVEIENLNDIKKQIQNLGGTKGKTKVGIPIDTASLESSLRDVSTTIKDIKNSIGTLDSKSGMKSLLSSINQISTALEKASDQFAELNANMNALGSKDLNLNFGINLGGSNPIARQTAYGNKARNDTLPQLKQQMSALVEFYNNTYKESADEFTALQKLVSGTKLSTGDFFQSFLYGKDSVAVRMSNGSLSSQMQAYKQYIDMFKQAASLKGLDLSGITSQFSKSADQLIQDAQDVQTGAREMDESFDKLKQIFGGGNNLNLDGISQQLDSIVVDLGEIKIALQGLSSGVSFDGLTQSFDRLSESIEQLVQNATQVKSVLGDNLNTSVTDSGTENAIQNQKELAQVSTQSANTIVQSEERKQQAIKETAEAVGQVSKIKIGNTELDALNLKDDIDEADRLAVALSKLKNIQSGIDKIEVGEIDISKGIQEIQTLERQLESLSNEYNETVAEINSMGGVSPSQWQSFQNDIDNTNRKIEQLQSNLREKIQTAIYTTVARDVQKAHSEFDKLSGASTELHQKLQLLDDIKVDLDAEKEHGDVQKLSELYTKYLSILKDVNAQLDIQKRAQRDSNSFEALEQKKNNLSLEMESWLKSNSAAAKQFGGTIRELQARIDACDDAGLSNLRREFQSVKKEAQLAGKNTQTFGDSLKAQFSKYSSYLSVASLYMYVEQGLRDMFEQVKLIDSAMTELKKVTDETDASYNKFLSNAASRSKEIGTTIDGLVSSTADFARLGYGFEDAQGLAEVANIYAVVGDEINGVEGATESLVSTMAAFKGEMDGMSDTDFAMSIIDKFNEIGNNFAISSGGIGEALERSASSLMAANNTIDESIALITAANTVVQDPAQVGEWLADIKSGYIG